jgi:hypothetical protein
LTLEPVRRSNSSMRKGNGLTAIMILLPMLGQPLWAIEKGEGPDPGSTAPSLSKSEPTNFVPTQKVACFSDLTPDESFLSLQIIQNQNIFARLEGAPPVGDDGRAMIGFLIQSLGTDIQSAIRDSNLPRDNNRYWRLMFASNAIVSEPNLGQIKEFLKDLSELNKEFLAINNFAIKQMLAPLVQMAVDHKILARGEINENEQDQLAYTTVVETLKGLKATGQKTKNKLCGSIQPNYGKSSELVEQTAMALANFQGSKLPPRLVHLIEILNVRLQNRIGLIPQSPGGEQFQHSQVLVERENLHEMIVYIHEIENYCTLTKIVKNLP